MRILVISPKNKTVFNFRGDLIRDMIANGHQVYVTGPNRDFVQDIMALGATEFLEVPLVKDNTSVFGDLAYFRKLRNVIQKIRPHLVFGYTIKPVIYGSLAARSCGVKQIYDGTFTGTLKPGQGMFAKALMEKGYKVVEPDELNNL